VDSFDPVLEVIDALDQVGIPYMLVGSMSSNLYGIPRSTQDADFVIELGDKSISKLAQILAPIYRLEAQMSFETMTGTHRYILERRDQKFKIELFMVSADPHDRSRFSRRTTVVSYGRRIVYPTAEDVIVTKLRWRRPKDTDDLKGVLTVQKGKLDLDYIRSWCDRHGSREAFERLLAECQ
jgi:hypothetical protein